MTVIIYLCSVYYIPGSFWHITCYHKSSMSQTVIVPIKRKLNYEVCKNVYNQQVVELGFEPRQSGCRVNILMYHSQLCSKMLPFYILNPKHLKFFQNLYKQVYIYIMQKSSTITYFVLPLNGRIHNENINFNYVSQILKMNIFNNYEKSGQLLKL